MLHGYWLNKKRTTAYDYVQRCTPYHGTGAAKKPKTRNCHEEVKLFDDRLKQVWLRAGPTSKSRMENFYDEHGTCIEVCLSLDGRDEVKCQIGKLLKLYVIGDILAKSNITPGRFYSLVAIHRAIKADTNRNPWIQCVYTSAVRSVGMLALLHEIRLFFDKDFQIINYDDAVVIGEDKLFHGQLKCDDEIVFTNATNSDDYIYYPESFEDAKGLHSYITNIQKGFSARKEMLPKKGIIKDGQELLQNYRASLLLENVEK